jgi:ubiquitin carboxyl-terminal hydrolase 9/24
MFTMLLVTSVVCLLVAVCKEALEVLTVALVLNPKTLESLTKDKMWHTFIIDLLLLCKNRYVLCHLI